MMPVCVTLSVTTMHDNTAKIVIPIHYNNTNTMETIVAWSSCSLAFNSIQYVVVA